MVYYIELSVYFDLLLAQSQQVSRCYLKFLEGIKTGRTCGECGLGIVCNSNLWNLYSSLICWHHLSSLRHSSISLFLSKLQIKHATVIPWPLATVSCSKLLSCSFPSITQLTASNSHRATTALLTLATALFQSQPSSFVSTPSFHFWTDQLLLVSLQAFFLRPCTFCISSLQLVQFLPKS
jgi:hypothetical protein